MTTRQSLFLSLTLLIGIPVFAQAETIQCHSPTPASVELVKTAEEILKKNENDYQNYSISLFRTAYGVGSNYSFQSLGGNEWLIWDESRPEGKVFTTVNREFSDMIEFSNRQVLFKLNGSFVAFDEPSFPCSDNCNDGTPTPPRKVYVYSCDMAN